MPVPPYCNNVDSWGWRMAWVWGPSGRHRRRLFQLDLQHADADARHGACKSSRPLRENGPFVHTRRSMLLASVRLYILFLMIFMNRVRQYKSRDDHLLIGSVHCFLSRDELLSLFLLLVRVYTCLTLAWLLGLGPIARSLLELNVPLLQESMGAEEHEVIIGEGVGVCLSMPPSTLSTVVWHYKKWWRVSSSVGVSVIHPHHLTVPYAGRVVPIWGIVEKLPRDWADPTNQASTVTFGLSSLSLFARHVLALGLYLIMAASPSVVSYRIVSYRVVPPQKRTNAILSYQPIQTAAPLTCIRMELRTPQGRPRLPVVSTVFVSCSRIVSVSCIPWLLKTTSSLDGRYYWSDLGACTQVYSYIDLAG